MNQLLGPFSLTLAGWGNDLLRSAAFMTAVLLVRQFRISVAGQMLMPLASLCYLPMPVLAESDDWQNPSGSRAS